MDEPMDELPPLPPPLPEKPRKKDIGRSNKYEDEAAFIEAMRAWQRMRDGPERADMLRKRTSARRGVGGRWGARGREALGQGTADTGASAASPAWAARAGRGCRAGQRGNLSRKPERFVAAPILGRRDSGSQRDPNPAPA